MSDSIKIPSFESFGISCRQEDLVDALARSGYQDFEKIDATLSPAGEPEVTLDSILLFTKTNSDDFYWSLLINRNGIYAAMFNNAVAMRKGGGKSRFLDMKSSQDRATFVELFYPHTSHPDLQTQGMLEIIQSLFEE
ncbi:MAG: hypothetical protein UT34_C0001G0367 [candidate division WS6 bacterium GW2011_GWF2_39_15]|uniref:Uncharacterized protein n=1 Tax=candidate division WS6 bacterium GW2011_GWF2_39_15 TaxID=1619100 RepID=A0A0G0QXH4_9BACT|nr:MAG: hypothetical protein UT34_C0001G0367 [candidate division WS6 bacterium GW2011_GWF2_39_15]